MRAASLAAAVLGLGLSGPAAAFTMSSSDRAPFVTLSPDSRVGWLPDQELASASIRALGGYLEAIDTLRFADAYDRLTDSRKRQESLGAFTARERSFREESGPAVEWRVLHVTWARDPVQSSGPGTYAVFDLSGRFQNIDRQCGYLIFYQAPSGGDFKVLRLESNYMPRPKPGTADTPQARAEMDRVWTALSAACPSYVPDGR